MLWGHGIWADYLWCRSFFGCHWNWPCWWLHPKIWSGVFRIVGIVVCMWCSFFHIQPRRSPCIHHRRVVCVMVWILILFGCGFTLFAFPNTIWLWLRGVCWCRQCAENWVEPRRTSWWYLWPTVFHPPIWICIIPLHFLLFSKNIDQLLQGGMFHITNFLDWRGLWSFLQKLSYIGDCLCDSVCCWHTGNFGWLWKNRLCLLITLS